MGDNLKAASRFISQSMTSLDHLIAAPALPQDQVLNDLSDLQRGAKAMRARSIYRAAQTAVDMLHKGQPEAVVQSELGVVRSLIIQYKTGLDEVLAEMNPVSAPTILAINETANIAANETAAPVMDSLGAPNLIDDLMTPINDAPVMTPDNISANSAGSDPAFNIARAGLEPLIQFAPEAEQRDSLRRLSRLQGEMTPPVSVANETSNKTAQANVASQKTLSKKIEFETLMPELTNIVLTTARHLGKTVSISYAANGARLALGLSESLRKALGDMAVVLVTRSLEAPSIRRERGESGAGHISIMADLKAGKLGLTIECTGRDISRGDLDIASWKTLQDLGGDVSLSRDDDRLRLIVTGLSASGIGRTKSGSDVDLSPELEQAS